MRQRTGRDIASVLGAVAAAGVALTLSGCEIFGITLPDLPIPENLSLPKIELPFLDGTVEPAEALDALTHNANSVTSPTVRNSGMLIVGVNSHSSLAPMTITTDSGTLVGMDVDVAAAIADALGVKVRFVPVENTSAAVNGTVDIVLSTTSDPSDADMAVVGSYAEDALAFYHKGAMEVVDASALMGATVGVQPGSASAVALDHTTLGMAVTNYDTLNDAFAALEAGEVQYVLCDAYAGAFLAGSYSDIAFAGTINTPAVRGAAVASSNVALQQAVQQALESIQGNGVLGVIRQRWVGDLPALTSDQQISNIPMVDGQGSDADSAEDEDEGTDGDEYYDED